MNKAAPAPTVAIVCASEEDTKWTGSVASNLQSSPMARWRESRLIPESPSELSTTCGDEFLDPVCFDIGSGLKTPSPLETSVPFEAYHWSYFFPDDLDPLLSTTSPSDQHHDTTDMGGEPRGRHLLSVSSNKPTGRSMSTPRSLQVTPTPIRRTVSTLNLTSPRFPRLAAGCDDTPSEGVPSLPSSLSGQNRHDTVTHLLDTYQYVDVDHDRASSARGNPDHPYSPSSSLMIKYGFLGSETSRSSSWVVPSNAHGRVCRPEEDDIFLTGGDCRPHSPSNYYNLSLDNPQSHFRTPFPPDPHLVPKFGLDCVIDPASSSGSGIEVDRASDSATGELATRIMHRSPGVSSPKPRIFRTNVGTKAMVEACKRRRKKRDSLIRLFVCEVPGCDRNFTARHNLRYHMKSHNNIRDEICQNCGSDFVTRETRRRHQKTCDGVKKRSRH